MRKLSISDITMKGQNCLSFREKIELSKLLDRLGVSVIETAPIKNVKIDSLLIKSLATAVKEATIAVPINLEQDSAVTAWNALKEAKHPRLQVCAPVSAVQMEYLAHKKPAAMLDAIEKAVAFAKTLCPEVEFVADDATRADNGFLASALQKAMDAGAGRVTVCDTAGSMFPEEFAEFLTELSGQVPGLSQVVLGVACSNALSMADSCAISAIRSGSGEVKASAIPMDAVQIESLAKIISNKGAEIGVSTSIRTTQLRHILGQISGMFATTRSSHSPFDNGVQENADLFLTDRDDMTTVHQAVVKLGYDLSDEDIGKVYEAFLHIAKRKEKVGSRELDAIVAAAAMQVPPTYQLESYVINTGNTISATAHMKLRKNGEPMEGISLGDGPIDASFLALESILGRHYELDDFQIQAITQGREAMGETVVKLRSNGKLYSGRGISTDILGASIMAYINALNKIVYEEEV